MFYGIIYLKKYQLFTILTENRGKRYNYVNF